MISKKRGSLFVAVNVKRVTFAVQKPQFFFILALLLLFFTSSFSTAQTQGCYIFPEASEDLYCVEGVLDSEAQLDCDQDPSCDMNQHFIPGSDCSEYGNSICEQITCSVDCLEHARGYCEELGGEEVTDEEYPVMCTPGCCYIEDAQFCEFGRNSFQCDEKASQTLGTNFNPADVIFDNSFGMNADKCIQLYCGGGVSKSTLQGVVKDVNGNSLAATIVLEGKGIETTTNSQGAYNFENINPGKYLMKVTSPGYLGSSFAIDLLPGETADRDFTLQKGEGAANIQGSVNDNSGNPVSGATISFSGPLSGQIFSNANGGYLIENLPEGDYALIASKVGYISNQQEVAELSAGTLALNFVLQPVSFQGAQGRTYLDINNNNELDSGDQAIYGAKIYVNGVFKGFSQYSQGDYKAEIPVGNYQLSASYQDYNFAPREVNIFSGQTLTMDLLLTKHIGECTFPNLPKDVETFSANHVRGKEEVKLTWTKPCPEVINYRITKFKNGVEVEEFTASPAEKSKIDTNAEWGETYRYEIAAVYDKGLISENPVSASITLGNEFCEERYFPETGWDLFCVTEPENRNKILSCGEENQLVISKDCSENDGPGEIYFCAQTGQHNAVCKNAGVCSVQPQQADPFGLYYSRNICYGSTIPETEGAANYCYYDYTNSIVNQCSRCDAITSCFDYKSEDACAINNCLGVSCGWVDSASNKQMLDYSSLFPDKDVPEFVTAETGVGYCVEKDYGGDDQCGLCGPDGGLFGNNFCTAEVCSGLGRCFSNSVTVDEPLSYCAECGEEPTTGTNCYTYTFESECNGGQNLEKNDREELVLSGDRCGWNRCLWLGSEGGAGSCVKDGDGDGKEDCSVFGNAGERNSCRRDNSAPSTKLLSEGLNIISLTQTKISFQAADRENVLGVIGYCLTSADSGNQQVCTDFTEEPYPGKLKDETISVNLAESKYLQKTIPGETYVLKYYSKDKYFNQENVRTTFVFVDNFPPQFEINENVDTQGDVTNLAVYLDGTNEPMECTFTLHQILPAGTTRSRIAERTKENKEANFESLQGVRFDLTVECEDNHGNLNSKVKRYTFDLEERISIVSPSPQGVIGSTEVVFEIETSAGASCALYGTSTNEKIADFISDEEGKSHRTNAIGGFVERGYAGEYKAVCDELFAEDSYEDFFHFSVDFTAPSTKIILQEGLRIVKPQGFGWEEFFIRSARINFECNAEGFACDKTFYCLGSGCDRINSPGYREYVSEFVLNTSTFVCYYSTDEAGNKVFQPTCGDVRVEGYGVTLERPKPYFFEGEMWGISSQPVFPWEFYTKVPTAQCAFDFSPGFDYITMPPHKVRELTAEGRYLYENFPEDVFSEYSGQEGVKTVYVKCENLEGELGPEQKIHLEYDSTPPRIEKAFAQPARVLEGISTQLFVETDDKTICRFSDNSEGDGSVEYESMEFSFSDRENVLDVQHQAAFYLNFQGAKKDYNINVVCKNGAGEFSEVEVIEFNVDYSALGGIDWINPSGSIRDTEVTLSVHTTKRAFCEYKQDSVYFPLTDAGSNTYSTSLGALPEGKYIIPVRCLMEEHQVESKAVFQVDFTSPVISEVNDGTFSCGNNYLAVMVYTHEDNLSGYFYEVYDAGSSGKDSSNKTAGLFNYYSQFTSGNGTTNQAFSSTASTPGELVFNKTVGPGLPIEVPTFQLVEDRKYIVRVSALDAAGNWGAPEDSDGFFITSGEEELCRNDNGGPKISVLINDSLPQSCSSTPVELRCDDITGCKINYGRSSSASLCEANLPYTGSKILFDKTEWICYGVEDNTGNNYTGTEKIVILDDDGDGILNSCDECAGTKAGQAADALGCSSSQIPESAKGVDSDGDGLPDLWEQLNNKLGCELDYLNSDSNGDGIIDNLQDYDDDGYTNFEEYLSGLNPCVADAPAEKSPIDSPVFEGEEADIIALIFLTMGLLMILGGSGYLIYYYLYSDKGKEAAKISRPGTPLRERSGVQSSRPKLVETWKGKLAELRKERDEKVKLRRRTSLFEEFSKDSDRIPHVEKILQKKKDNLPKLKELAKTYSEHKEEINPGLRREEKEIFAKLGNIAKETKEKKIHEIVSKDEAKDIFDKLKQMSKKRKK